MSIDLRHRYLESLGEFLSTLEPPDNHRVPRMTTVIRYFSGRQKGFRVGELLQVEPDSITAVFYEDASDWEAWGYPYERMLIRAIKHPQHLKFTHRVHSWEAGS